MLFITQLIYINEGEEEAFHEFESKAIPIINNYNGALALRVKPTAETWIDGTYEMPYEVHLVSFNTEEDFTNFMNDNERKQHLHLKEKAIKKVIVIKGSLLS